MTVATLDGRPLLGDAPQSWDLVPGTSPHTAEFSVSPADAAALLSGPPRPVTLSIGTGEGVLDIRFLYVIEGGPGPNPHVARVRVADRRWMWQRVHVLRRYNIRRNIGVKRVTSGSGIPVLDPVTDDVKYAPWSLDGDKKWNARRVLDDVFGEIIRADIGGGGVSLSAAETVNALPIENLELDESGADAVRRALSHLPGLDVTVDASGSIRVYSRISGGELAVVRAAGAESMTGGHVAVVSHARTRPSGVRVLFTREIELRLDFEELGDGATSARGRDDRFMENVLPVPDHTLSVNGKPLAQGTWIPITSALSAWGAPPGLGTLDFAALRKAEIPFLDMWAPILLSGARAPDADWAGRVAALRQNYRRTFRVNRRWMDRILSLFAYRVATVDPVTGTRGPPAVWSNWSTIGTQRSMIAESSSGDDLTYAINVESFAGGDIGSDTKQAPCDVEIVDRDQGIIRLHYRIDEFRLREIILPGIVQNGPRQRVRGKNAITFDSIVRGSGTPTLAATHHVAAIITAIPASPNTDAQLHAVTVRPSDVAHILPSPLQGGLLDARGPVMEIRVGASYETARVAWKDGRERDIEWCFGIRPSGDVSGLTINTGAQDSIGGAAGSLDAIAQAVAARVYASFADRIEGSMDAYLSLSARVDGFLESLRHSVGRRGEAQTTFTLAGRGPDLNLESFLPANVLRVVRRLAHAGKEA